MSPANTFEMPAADRTRLRDLAKRKVDIANEPLNRARLAEWFRHRRCEPGRPLILIETGEIAPLVGAGELCRCESDTARGIEYGLVVEQYMWDTVGDDHVVLPKMRTPWFTRATGYGVEVPHQQGAASEHGRGSSRWDAPVKDLDADFEKLQARTFSVDREGTLAHHERSQELFGDILSVELGAGGFWWSVGMTNTLISLIGLENMMMAMIDQPAGLHRVMGFLRDDYLAHARWAESEGLLTLNNEDHYTGSGSLGFTRELPADGYVPGQPARLKDLWVLSESQETVLVGPDMFEEFIFPYQLDLINEFGLCYYGCCEPVNNRWHVLKQIPNLRAVSVSPWADQDAMAEGCGREVLFCRKPNPAMISTPHFDEDAIRADLRGTLTAAKNCNVEIVMKDIHTISKDPTRPARWIALAREVCSEFDFEPVSV